MSTAEARLRKRGTVKGTENKGASQLAPPKSTDTSATPCPLPQSRIHTAWLCGLVAACLAILGVSIQKLWPAQTLQNTAKTPFTANGSSPFLSTDLPPDVESINNIEGIFPWGCQWRDVQHDGSANKKFWATEEYEYWHGDVKQWKADMPETCTVRGTPAREGYNNGRFYLLVDGPAAVAPWKMTRNQDLNVLHVDDANQWAAPLDAKVVSGDTLIFDFVYFLHPTAIGHWSEMMFPLFSILRLEPAFKRPPKQFMLLHLKRVHLMEWARAVMSVALGVNVHETLPPMLMQQETDSVWTQIPSPLEGYGPNEWVSFERALVVRDIFTGGVRTFLSTEDAQAFRALIYKQYNLPAPEAGKPVPRVITFQRKRANRRVINEDQLMRMLREFGEVRVVEFNATTSFHEQLQIIASTGVFISVHTSNLANAQFLPPGAAVFEIIQRNWCWENLDRSFQVQTEMMGDIHHYAWRARHRNQTVYINKRDSERFGDWTSQQCATEDCVEAHTNVDVVVNVNEFRALLRDRLPHVWAGKSVAEAVIPWPEV
ncbi:hypothetical protein ABBQ38_009607 [Trebouxia sp. C0009 RCD-2024]